MKYKFLTVLFVGVLSACASPAQNTGPVDPFIENCIADGFTHQVCACASITARAEIGEQSYGELLTVAARMAQLKAQGQDAPVTDPNAGVGEYQVLETAKWNLLGRKTIVELASQANTELCSAQGQN